MRRHWRCLASQRDPELVHPYIGLGGVCYDLKRYEEAILAYQGALRRA